VNNSNLKKIIVLEIQKYIKESKLTQNELSNILGVNQNKISFLLNDKISGIFSTDKLIKILEKTGKNIIITIK